MRRRHLLAALPLLLSASAMCVAACGPPPAAGSNTSPASGADQAIAEPDGATTEAAPGWFDLPLGLAMGMTLSAARDVLAAAGAVIDEHDDDKPFRGFSVKVRVQLPAGHAADSATIYFVYGRLWRVKLRPGRAVCRDVEGVLGPVDVDTPSCSLWTDPERLRGAARCDEMCHLIDTSVWIDAGVSRAEAEEAYAGFHDEVERARGR